MAYPPEWNEKLMYNRRAPEQKENRGCFLMILKRNAIYDGFRETFNRRTCSTTLSGGACAEIYRKNKEVIGDLLFYHHILCRAHNFK
jgi:hypothetical protein